MTQQANDPPPDRDLDAVRRELRGLRDDISAKHRDLGAEVGALHEEVRGLTVALQGLRHEVREVSSRSLAQSGWEQVLAVGPSLAASILFAIITGLDADRALFSALVSALLFLALLFLWKYMKHTRRYRDDRTLKTVSAATVAWAIACSPPVVLVSVVALVATGIGIPPGLGLAIVVAAFILIVWPNWLAVVRLDDRICRTRLKPAYGERWRNL